jgi:hypothetical protein
MSRGQRAKLKETLINCPKVDTYKKQTFQFREDSQYNIFLKSKYFKFDNIRNIFFQHYWT